MIDYNPSENATLSEICVGMLRSARVCGEAVRAVYDGVELIGQPHFTFIDVLNQYVEKKRLSGITPIRYS